MISDTERREVARRLRELHPEDRSWWGIHGFDWYEFAGYLFEAIGFDKGDCDEWTERLADLIEPTCDRDALLALANEIEYRAKLDIKKRRPYYGANGWLATAARIRKAIGVDINGN